MLEQKDLEMIAEVVTKTIEPIKIEITEMKTEITEMKSMDQLILAEIGREHEILVSKIEKVQQNLDELNQYYKITKLENDNTAILLQMINELSKRIENLEKRSA